MRYLWEKYYPLAVSVVLVVALFFNKHYITDFNTLIPSLMQNSLSVSATLLGFLLTILTVVNTIDTRRMQFIKSAGRFDDLMFFLKNAIYSNLIVIAICLFSLFINRSSVQVVFLLVVDYLFFFLLFLALTYTLRFTIIFMKLLTDKKED